MFNRLPGTMLSLGHTHQWRKGRNCSRFLSQHTAAIGTPTDTVCSIRAARTHTHGPYTDSPQWSPDGQNIAFTSHSNGNRDIYVITSAGAVRRLTWEPSEEGRA